MEQKQSNKVDTRRLTMAIGLFIYDLYSMPFRSYISHVHVCLLEPI